MRSEHKTWAEELKAGHRGFCGDMAERAVILRDQLRDRGLHVAKLQNLEDALNQLTSFQELVVSSVTNGGERKPRIEDAGALYKSVMANPFMGRMWKSVLFFIVSWARQWQDQRKNFDPSFDRDDYVDMTLPLYAAQGDVILTADSKLKMIIAAVEPAGSVTTGNAENF